MPQLFEFATAQRILFGEGQLAHAGGIAAGYGRRILVVTGSSTSRAEPLLKQFRERGLEFEVFPVRGEPDTAAIIEGTVLARRLAPQLVCGFGGGGALDAAKAIAAMAVNPGDLFDYLEVIGKARPITCRPLPCIAIPTTAGTGSEVTRNAVIKSAEHGVKVSMRHPDMLAAVAIVDPLLTLSMPKEITAASGLDALTQVIEPYVSRRANALTDALCREGIQRVARALRRAYFDGNDVEARSEMCLASLFGGMALASAGLGAVHGFAGPAGGMFPAAHGAFCARLLGEVMEVNYRALQARDPGNPALGRYDEIGRLLTGKPDATVADGIAWVRAISQELRIPSLQACGITEEDIPALVQKSIVASSMQHNPVTLNETELAGILTRCLGPCSG